MIDEGDDEMDSAADKWREEREDPNAAMAAAAVSWFELRSGGERERGGEEAF